MFNGLTRFLIKKVFHLVGSFVQMILRQCEFVVEKFLPQSMPSDNLFSPAAAKIGKLDSSF